MTGARKASSMKKIAAIIITISLLFPSLVGCQFDTPQVDDDTTYNTEQYTTTSEPQTTQPLTISPSDEDAIARAIEYELIPPELQHTYTESITYKNFIDIIVVYLDLYYKHASKYNSLADYIEREGLYKYNGEYYDGINDDNVKYTHVSKVLPYRGRVYEPHENLTRLEAAILFTNLYYMYGSSMAKTTEAGFNHHYADEAEMVDNYSIAEAGINLDAARFMWEWGYLTGDENDNLHPHELFTRGEACAVICRIYERELESWLRK